MRPAWIVLGITLSAPALPRLNAQSLQRATATEAISAVSKASDSAAPMPLVQALTERFGPRLTGSEQEHQAAVWALGEMRSVGLSHVHTETWTLHRGWQRGHAEVRLVKPYSAPLNIVSYGWSGSTQGAVSGQVVLTNGNMALSESSTKEWAGKVVLVAPTSMDGIRAVADAPVLANWAEKVHALAVIDGIPRPGSMLLHTGPIGFPGREASVPVLDMLEEQRQLLQRMVNQGAAPRLRLDVASRFTAAPVSVENVVGEIEGAVRPEEVVLMGAHLDSWDLSPGATDDATGVAAVLAAANVIRTSGVRPDRTIRFVLFTGEEQGLLGSQAYVQQHRAELPNIVCAVVVDWGAGPITKIPLAGHPEMEQPIKSLLQLGNGLQTISTSSGFLTFTDSFSFTLAGLPGISPWQDSPHYDRDAHSTMDSLQQVDATALRFNTKVLAMSAIWLADVTPRPGTLFPPNENKRALSPLRNALRMLGMWPD